MKKVKKEPIHFTDGQGGICRDYPNGEWMSREVKVVNCPRCLKILEDSKKKS